MSTIIKELDAASIELKTRRTVLSLDINLKNQTINTYYNEQKYYLDADSNEVLVGEPTVGAWAGDYATWFASPSGVAIKAAIEVELIKPVPGV